MDSDRSRQSRRQSFKQPLDRRVDNWIETGRQFVDGVAGNRPGRRPNTSRISGASFEKVGRWVGDKLDWFLEDEESWVEPWQTDTHQEKSSNTKRPLEAISRRVSRQIPSSPKNSPDTCEDDEWPEDSAFRVDRWRRSSEVNETVDSSKLRNSPRDSISFERRPLPRSSRRRD